MRRSPVPVAVVTLAVLMIGLLAYGLIASGSSTNLDTAVQRGERPAAPVATLELQNLGRSGTTSLSDLRGSIVVVNIWGSWCAPCEAEAPILSAMHRALERTGEGQVLGVTRVDASSRSLEKVREWGLPYPSIRDVDDELYDAFGGTGTPETFILDQQGRVVAMARQPIDAEFANAALKAAGARARIPASTELAS